MATCYSDIEVSCNVMLTQHVLILAPPPSLYSTGSWWGTASGQPMPLPWMIGVVALMLSLVWLSPTPLYVYYIRPCLPPTASPSLFPFFLSAQVEEEEEHNTVSRINIIDLAGSERSKVSETSGERLKVCVWVCWLCSLDTGKWRVCAYVIFSRKVPASIAPCIP